MFELFIPAVHDDCAVQGVTDGHRVVTGHQCQAKDVQHCKECEKINLCDASFIATNFALCLDKASSLKRPTAGVQGLALGGMEL